MPKIGPLLLTCEHGGNRVPRILQPYVRKGLAKALGTHRGYDIGALGLARHFAAQLRAPLLYSQVSRLVVDLNRSLHHPKLIAPELAQQLDQTAVADIIERYYVPHRQEVSASLRTILGEGERAIHIAVHSFTPRLHGKTRQAELGLLYDPAQPEEAAWCQSWQKDLRARMPEFVIRRNYPYRGASDGLTKSLRVEFTGERYIGIELEVNNKLLTNPVSIRTLRRHLVASLRMMLLTPAND